MKNFACGLVLGAVLASATGAFAYVVASVDTNGVLEGYIVQDRRGREVCRNPSVQIQFRGPESYILCR